jgi:hypothetical protein
MARRVLAEGISGGHSRGRHDYRQIIYHEVVMCGVRYIMNGSGKVAL